MPHERRVGCVGGPCDGLRVLVVRDSVLRWIDRRGYGWSRWGIDRSLYQLVGDRYVYQGHGFGQCVGCDAVLQPDPVTGAPLSTCPLCGGASASAMQTLRD